MLSYVQWFMVIFGALIILAGVPWLLFVQRRGYEPKTTSQMPPLAPYVQAAPEPAHAEELRREVKIAFQRAYAWTPISMGAGVILGAGIQFALDRVTASSGFGYTLTPIESSLFFGGMILGAGVGALFGTGLAPRDLRRAHPPARRLTDLVSPLIVLTPLALVSISLSFALYRAAHLPLYPFAVPLVRAFPWLPYGQSLILLGAVIIACVCAVAIAGIAPRRWTSQGNAAEAVDRSCRTTLIGQVLLTPTWFTGLLIADSTGSGYLHMQTLSYANSWHTPVYTIAALSIVGLGALVLYFGRSGQLGGRLTGWPWQGRATPQAAG